MNIPKIIHQIWYNDNPEIPEKWKRSREEWIRLHKDYKYILWDRKSGRDLIVKYEPHMLFTYDNFEYEIERIDAVRPVILKHFGGIYCDLDMVPLRHIEEQLELKEDIYLVSSPEVFLHFNNCFMISSLSKKAGEFWDKYIEIIKQPLQWYTKICKTTKVLAAAGPYALTRAVLEGNSSVVTLPYNIFDPSIKTKYIYFDKLDGHSWFNLSTKILLFLYRNFRKIIVFILLLIIILIILVIYYSKKKRI